MLCCSYSKLFKFSNYRKTAEDKQNSNYNIYLLHFQNAIPS